MQLNAVGKEKQDRFKNYMEKTYKKTASLMANSCKAVRCVHYVPCHVCLHVYLCMLEDVSRTCFNNFDKQTQHVILTIRTNTLLWQYSCTYSISLLLLLSSRCGTSACNYMPSLAASPYCS